MLAELMKEHQRLVILRMLSEDSGYDLNESILQDGINAVGLDISRDALRTQLAWLEEQGLISVENVGNIKVARLNGRGLDVANGRANVPGIKRPSPK
jgi:DNA-binding transcriptional ArsR family regulator